MTNHLFETRITRGLRLDPVHINVAMLAHQALERPSRNVTKFVRASILQRRQQKLPLNLRRVKERQHNHRLMHLIVPRFLASAKRIDPLAGQFRNLIIWQRTLHQDAPPISPASTAAWSAAISSAQ